MSVGATGAMIAAVVLVACLCLLALVGGRMNNDWATARLSGHLEARGGEGLFWATLAVLVAVLVVSLL